ncbi:MAG: DNA translocase FtsK [Candidatus Fermentibacteraceae bacterium]|nr:DNA translocase FtsK [Candidatus Fermentibacteraceae bacterium]
MAERRRRATVRSSRRGGPGRARNFLLVTVIFLGAATAVVLAVPAPGFAGSVRRFLLDRLGLLSVLVPLFLLQTGAMLLNLRFRRSGFRVLSGITVTGYFFAAALDFVVSMRSPGFHNLPGGSVAGGIGDLLAPVTGAPITFLILFTAFTASLVAFTGWDIGGDFQSLADRLQGLFERKGKKGGGRKPGDAPKEKNSGPNAWSRDKTEEPVAEIPFQSGSPGTPAVPSAGKTSPPVPETGRIRVSPQGISGGLPRRAEDTGDPDGYMPPPLSCLDMPDEKARVRMTQDKLDDLADLLVEKLMDFGIECTVSATCPGPVITRFEVEPGPGIKVNRFVALSDDLALALKAKRIRILAPVPGKGAVGIEVPNPYPETVYLREVIDRVSGEELPIALGKKIEGEPFVADITAMPHLLIAGATGSGKSVCMHSIIASMLLSRTPSEVRFAMIDPKMLELSIYEGIPHLWAPVVIETEKSTMLLEALVREMENRYKRLSRMGVRSIQEFNSKLTPESEDERIPFIVLFIDELADLMVTVSRDIEPAISRLAHMARAVGIHMVLATQRPSVDVITGVIKANFPSRIAFNVQSKTDSRTILDMNGAEKLLGKGDMLFLPTTSPEPVRIHGSFISTEETRTIVEHLRDQPSIPYEFDFPDTGAGIMGGGSAVEINDPLFEKARDVVVLSQQGSVSIIQRRLRVGYSRAASLIDMLEQAGVVGPFQGSKARDVLVGPDELECEVADEDE